MPILLIIPAISEYYPDIAANDNKNIFKLRYTLMFGWGGSASARE